MAVVALIDYGSGNLRSAAKAFERAAGTLDHPWEVMVTADAEQVRRADAVVLPGVGAFGDCRRGLDGLAGMGEALAEAVLRRRVPFLGICVGMQLMAEVGREYGTCPGLGWIPGEVVPLNPEDPELKIPHMGWNELEFLRPHPLFAGLPSGTHGYFVHSYHLLCREPEHRLATVDYGCPVTAAVGRDNLAGTQFHPEKSQAAGLAIIANFLRWRP